MSKPDYLLDPEERSDIRCACLEGLMTGGEHHESWCPSLMGDPLDNPDGIDQDATNRRSS